MSNNETVKNGLIRRWILRVIKPASVGVGVTVLTSLIPFVGLLAPAIGGGVASRFGSPTDRNGLHVGLITGVLVVLLSLPITFLAVAAAAAISPVATVAVLGMTLIGAGYVLGSSTLGGYLADEFASELGKSTNTDKNVIMNAESGTQSPTERLKKRYVDGKIDHDEFERRLERLVAAETVDETAHAETAESHSDQVVSREDTSAARE